MKAFLFAFVAPARAISGYVRDGCLLQGDLQREERLENAARLGNAHKPWVGRYQFVSAVSSSPTNHMI